MVTTKVAMVTIGVVQLVAKVGADGADGPPFGGNAAPHAGSAQPSLGPNREQIPDRGLLLEVTLHLSGGTDALEACLLEPID